MRRLSREVALSTLGAPGLAFFGAKFVSRSGLALGCGYAMH